MACVLLCLKVIAVLNKRGAAKWGKDSPLKGIFTALSGAMAQSQRLDTIANNIANVNTPGFKKDQQVFREYLTAYENPGDLIRVPRVTASIPSFYDMQGGDKSYVDSAGTFTDFSQGTLKQTNRSLDVAIEGKAFFEVLTPDGVKLTRDGSFSTDAQGRLVTQQGYPVLREGKPAEDPKQRVIVLTGPNVSISPDGSIQQDGNVVARLSAVTPDNPDALIKVGGNLYGIKSNQDPGLRIATNSTFHQGYLEDSNVNIVKEMTNMITATRTFETNERAIKAYDTINGKLVNDVPEL